MECIKKPIGVGEFWNYTKLNMTSKSLLLKEISSFVMVVVCKTISFIYLFTSFKYLRVSGTDRNLVLCFGSVLTDNIE